MVRIAGLSRKHREKTTQAMVEFKLFQQPGPDVLHKDSGFETVNTA